MAARKHTDEELLAAVEQHGGKRPAARALRINCREMCRRLKRIEARRLKIPPLAPATPDGFEVRQLTTRLNAAGQVRSQSVQVRPEGRQPAPGEVVPAGHLVKGLSTFVDGDGSIRSQWVKTAADAEQRQRVLESTLAAMVEKIEPLEPVEGPRVTAAELCNVYTMTDCHLGALAWHKEGGADWDLQIAERVLSGTFLRMIEAAPQARVGIVAQLGDWGHTDGFKPLTPEHGHVLDADSRFPKIAAASTRILRRIIAKALERHELVVVQMHEGNHDPTSAVWLREFFGALYENEPRVYVERSPLPYVIHLHGRTLLGWHHGHLAKNESLPNLFAARFRKEWGAAAHCYIHTGHRHHVEEKEYPGANVVQHPTIAAADAYAARGGWFSKRQASVITYHEEHGEHGRLVFVPEMVA